MTVKLLNAFPNSFLPREGQELVIKGISEAEASKILKEGFQSFIGHESFASVLSPRLGVDIPLNRGQASLEGTVLIAAVIPPRRLGEGELWTEEEILNMSITYVLIEA
jgi:hypothetical protein